MSADKTEKENLLNSTSKAGATYYDEESHEISGNNANITNLNSIIEDISTVDGAKTIICILFIVFECIPIIMGGYILNNHYSLYFVAVFALSLAAVIFFAKEKYHYVLITLFMYGTYIFLLFAIACDAFKQENAEIYHIQKLKTVSILWIVLQFVMASLIYYKCCKPQNENIESDTVDIQ